MNFRDRVQAAFRGDRPRPLSTGTPDEIRTEVARLWRELGRGGGYILALAKPLMPAVPTTHATAVMEAFALATEQRWMAQGWLRTQTNHSTGGNQP